MNEDSEVVSGKQDDARNQHSQEALHAVPRRRGHREARRLGYHGLPIDSGRGTRVGASVSRWGPLIPSVTVRSLRLGGRTLSAGHFATDGHHFLEVG